MFDSDAFPGEGVTESERYLSRLCRRTFLSLWSYSGVFRDQGRRNGRGDGKELCDLLVVFDNHVIIFSDKHCQFPNSGDLMVDWSRWFKKAILKSAEQVFGAERWLVEFPESVFLDRTCTQPFPLVIPAASDAQFHRVVVCRGAEAKCRKVLGGSGSLAIRPDVVGNGHFDFRRHNVEPFSIGNIDPSKGFVHVLDGASLDLILSELDTITDFVRYLDDKEQLIQSGSLQFAAGEEDLLAHYLYPLEGREGNGFLVPQGDRLRVGARLWDSYVKDDFREARQDANKVSYLWDDIIELVSQSAHQNNQNYATEPGIEGAEKVLRLLAREPRLRRRILARDFWALVVSAGSGRNRRVTRWKPKLEPQYPAYVFLLMSEELNGIDPSEIRDARRWMLDACCEALLLRFPGTDDIVGIASELGPEPSRSFDIAYVDGSSYTDEELRQAKKRVDALGLIKNVSVSFGEEFDYPHPDAMPTPNFFVRKPAEMKGKDRNRLCPCGSGRKMKHCCGSREPDLIG